MTLSVNDLRHLANIDEYCVSADYWEDETIKRYRSLGLVWCDGKQIHLTEGGKRACTVLTQGTDAARQSPYHPI